MRWGGEQVRTDKEEGTYSHPVAHNLKRSGACPPQLRHPGSLVPATPQPGRVTSHLRASPHAEPKCLHRVHLVRVLSSFNEQIKTTSLSP